MIPPAIPGGYQSYQSAVPSRLFPLRPLVFLLAELIETHKTVSLRQVDRALDRYMVTGLLCVDGGPKIKYNQVLYTHIGRMSLFVVGRRTPMCTFTRFQPPRRVVPETLSGCTSRVCRRCGFCNPRKPDFS